MARIEAKTWYVTRDQSGFGMPIWWDADNQEWIGVWLAPTRQSLCDWKADGRRFRTDDSGRDLDREATKEELQAHGLLAAPSEVSQVTGREGT